MKSLRDIIVVTLDIQSSIEIFLLRILYYPTLHAYSRDQALVEIQNVLKTVNWEQEGFVEVEVIDDGISIETNYYPDVDAIKNHIRWCVEQLAVKGTINFHSVEALYYSEDNSVNLVV